MSLAINTGHPVPAWQRDRLALLLNGLRARLPDLAGRVRGVHHGEHRCGDPALTLTGGA
ncbi:MAG: hypothetical protein ACRDRU_17650 [Pseudonocardiaceae bacterium]